MGVSIRVHRRFWTELERTPPRRSLVEGCACPPETSPAKQRADFLLVRMQEPGGSGRNSRPSAAVPLLPNEGETRSSRTTDQANTATAGCRPGRRNFRNQSGESCRWTWPDVRLDCVFV